MVTMTLNLTCSAAISRALMDLGLNIDAFCVTERRLESGVDRLSVPFRSDFCKIDREKWYNLKNSGEHCRTLYTYLSM